MIQMPREDSLQVLIKETLLTEGLRPVQFEKSLKNVGAPYHFQKVIEPRHIVERHQAIGWCLCALAEHFQKQLYNIKSLSMQNRKSTVEIEALVYVSGCTSEDDHIAWLDGLAQALHGIEYPSHGYAWTRLSWAWDSIDRIGEVDAFIQMTGDGESTKVGRP